MGALENNIYRNRYLETSERFVGTFKLLSVWKGSVFRLIWSQMIVYLALYFLLSLLYRFGLTEQETNRERFELICIFCERFTQLIPLTFLIGFYVSQVVSRWWNMFMALPFPDKVALKLISYVAGKDDFTKNLRRTVMRYLNLSTVLVYRLVSRKVEERFPDLQSLVEAKLLLPHEALRLQKVDGKTPHESTWTPLLWSLKLLQKARDNGKIKLEPPVYANMASALHDYDGQNRKVLNYGWIEFPIAYTQVATIAVYCYFGATLFWPSVPHTERGTPGQHNISSYFQLYFSYTIFQLQTV